MRRTCAPAFKVRDFGSESQNGRYEQREAVRAVFQSETDPYEPDYFAPEGHVTMVTPKPEKSQKNRFGSATERPVH